jgi:hypothetical protein
MVYDGKAYWSTIENVTQMQADSIAAMKDTLGFSNGDVIQYLRTNLLKDYPTGRVAV